MSCGTHKPFPVPDPKPASWGGAKDVIKNGPVKTSGPAYGGK